MSITAEDEDIQWKLAKREGRLCYYCRGIIKKGESYIKIRVDDETVIAHRTVECDQMSFEWMYNDE